MALAKVTIEALTQMANILRQSAEDILVAKEQMDSELYSIPWDDPIGLNFISRYEEDFKPLKNKLIPNIESYIQYIQSEGVVVSEYSGENAGGLGAGGAVGAGAMGVGIGVAGATRFNSNPKKSDVFTNPLDLIAKGSQATTPPVFETGRSTIRGAAAGILEEMTEKDLFIDSNEMQNRLSEKTDEIFMSKYNKSINEIGLDSGFDSATSGYFDDYNNISEGLRKEVMEMKEKFEPTPIKYMDNEEVYAELSPEQKTTYDTLKNEILERKEDAEYLKTIANIDKLETEMATPLHSISSISSRRYEADKEIKKAEVDFKELEKWAKEAVRNNRNQKIAEYISK